MHVCLCARKEKKKRRKKERTEYSYAHGHKSGEKKYICICIYISAEIPATMTSFDPTSIASFQWIHFSVEPVPRSRLTVIQWQPGHSAHRTSIEAPRRLDVLDVVAEVDRQWSWTKCNSKPRVGIVIHGAWNTEKVGGVNWFLVVVRVTRFTGGISGRERLAGRYKLQLRRDRESRISEFIFNPRINFIASKLSHDTRYRFLLSKGKLSDE